MNGHKHFNRAIGIVGGMGPGAGIDLATKIVYQTIAKKDQEHLPLILFSMPGNITDRTEYILGRSPENPAYKIADILLALEKAGATVAGLACNTAHAPRIFDVVKTELAKQKSSIRLLHMIDEVGDFIKNQYPHVKHVGILGTCGTHKTNLYARLARNDLEIINISSEEQEKAHSAIYDPEHGIKSGAGEISEQSRFLLFAAADSLKAKGAKAIILGCTELPMVFKEKTYAGIPLVDSTLILARALIHAHSPGKLKPWNP